jgi:hypothetical protein
MAPRITCNERSSTTGGEVRAEQGFSLYDVYQWSAIVQAWDDYVSTHHFMKRRDATAGLFRCSS